MMPCPRLSSLGAVRQGRAAGLASLSSVCLFKPAPWREMFRTLPHLTQDIHTRMTAAPLRHASPRSTVLARRQALGGFNARASGSTRSARNAQSGQMESREDQVAHGLAIGHHEPRYWTCPCWRRSDTAGFYIYQTLYSSMGSRQHALMRPLAHRAGRCRGRGSHSF